MFDFSSKDINRFKLLGYLSLLIIFIILFVFGIRYYFSKSIMEDWTGIAEEKKKEIHVECLNLFYNYQNQASQFSYQLSRNRKLVNSVIAQNSRKSYEALFEAENFDDYNIEIFNPRLELVLFSGRQISPDITELKRAMNGERFSTVKEVGIYTFIVVFDPLKNESGVTEGILVTSRLLDISYDVQTRFFNKTGLKREIFEKYHIDVLFEYGNTNLAGSLYDTASGEVSAISLKNINQEVIGRIIIPNMDQSSYLLSVINKFDSIIGFLVFILNLVLIYWVIIAASRAESYTTRIIMVSIALLLSRYLWLALNFPGNFVTELGIDIFSPVHYASGIGFGMSKSLGELFVTSIVLLVISVYLCISILKFYKAELPKDVPIWQAAGMILLTTILIFVIMNFYGSVVHSLIFDSTIKFIDKGDLFSISQPELVTVRIIFLCFSTALLITLLSLGLLIQKNLSPYIASSKFMRKNSVLLIFAGLIILNMLLSAVSAGSIDFTLSLNLRALIFSIAGLFTYYVYRQLTHTRDFRLITMLNFSLVLLACAIFVPALLLNKIVTLENKYLEKAAKEVSQQSSDKISFLISSTLEDISSDVMLESDIKNKNKFSKLAFNIWASSKFYDEDLNSAVFVLDTSKKLISDFNINPEELLSDSVISFTLRSQDKKQTGEEEELSEDNEEPETLDLNLVNNPMVSSEATDVLQNTEMKFYSAMVPLERTDLRNSKFSNTVGYVIIAAGYDAKNFLTQTNLGIFKNFTRDNILNKLTSNPVISEFSQSEIVGSSNKEVSKSLSKSLGAFRESVSDRIDKSALRYDEFEDEIYKSYYVLTESKTGGGEKIYVVSVKVNDFSLSTFFFFRFLLFVVLVYMIFLAVYLLYKGFSYLLDTESVKFISFGFREKLFVSFMLASVIPIVILAIYTREFVNDKNDDFYKNQLLSDLRLVEQYVKNRTGPEDLNPEKNIKKPVTGTFTKLFDKGFSESDKNFNYYYKTKLAATTSEQLYKSDLLDTRISGSAFYNIALLKRDYFAENQQIGDYTFIVGYKPVYDNLNNLAGIISTQTVFKQSEINQELTESLVYILGPYFAAVIVLIFIVNFLSYRISNPILKLQKATEQLSKGNIDVQVRSNSKDEIGELVRSFNRMIRELKRSRAELKKAEREGAWRDIARQVAHEIKNPLTPMKLAMQHLFYAYNHGSNDFKSIIQTTNKLIIDQIETLNRIATEFSNFAKLPSRNYELLNMNEILSDVVKLMNTSGRIHLELDPELNSGGIMGDKDEVRRALINIIKNSMQAIEESEDIAGAGKINIISHKYNGYYSLKIKDNGVGMDDETQSMLFEPYFSTKSSGMGLGLVITKKILDDMKAKITVTSRANSGTEVEIRFKIESPKVV
jgi:nitrogen fixation/metabolism regulation signal transduction histidine kinase